MLLGYKSPLDSVEDNMFSAAQVSEEESKTDTKIKREIETQIQKNVKKDICKGKVETEIEAEVEIEEKVEKEAQQEKVFIAEKKEQNECGFQDCFTLPIDFQCAGKHNDDEEELKFLET